MIHIGILEDEAQVREQLARDLLQISAQWEERVEIRQFDRAEALLENPSGFDLLLLDIFLGNDDPNGIEVARAIRKQDRNTLIIFVTNLTQYAVQGYSVHAFDFIVKPVHFPLFAEKIGHAFERIRALQAQFITLRTTGGIQRINMSSILYVESFRHELIAHTKDGKIRLSGGGSMASMEDRLSSAPFFRCHASYIVNLKKVQQVDRLSLKIEETTLPISRHRRKEFMQALLDCLRKEVV